MAAFRKFALLLLVVSLALMGTPAASVLFRIEYHISDVPDMASTWRDQIRIIGDDDFSEQGWSGSGKKSDPYVLENLRIECVDGPGIYVANTTAHFVIRDCNFVAAGWETAWRFNNVTNGHVRSCRVYSCWWILESSQACTIEGIKANGGGYLLDECRNCNVLENNLSEMLVEDAAIVRCVSCNFSRNLVFDMGFGVWIGHSTNCSINENVFEKCRESIFIHDSNNTAICENEVYDSHYSGIQTIACENITLTNNALRNCGFDFSLGTVYSGEYPFQTFHLSGNTVNGKSLGFFRGLQNTSLSVSSYGQLILLNCSNVMLAAGSLSNISTAIHMHLSRNCSIRGVSISNCSHAGIDVLLSEGIHIHDCTITNPDSSWDDEYEGVRFFESTECSLTNTTVSGGMSGFILHSCNSSEVVGNSISSTWSGLTLTESLNCSIIGNRIASNRYGLTLHRSRNCSIINNTVVSNRYGISLRDSSHYNVLYGNRIGWNEAYNARDESRLNMWDNGENVGNFWSDYNGRGVYEIDFYAVDRYPRVLLGDPVEFLWGLSELRIYYLAAALLGFVLVLMVKLADEIKNP